MREIKFRAWDKETKHMFQDVPTGTIVITDWSLHLEVESKDCIFMQYTGLKDKNGKEIYEGDILDYKTNYEPYKCVIEWDDDLCSCGCCYDEHHSVGFVGRVLPGSKYGYSSLAKNYEAMEIIGNIYENPELLKEVQDE